MPLYRLLITLFAPVMALSTALRMLRGAETLADLEERVGGGTADTRISTALVRRRIWLHCASLGEANSARPLIEALLKQAPGCEILVTTNSTSGRAAVVGWHLERVEARLAPFDLRWCVGRFLDAHRPTALVGVENELWPNRMVLAEIRGLPIAFVAARLSARSAKRWHVMGGVARAVLTRVTLLSAQDDASEARLLALGLPEDRLVPKLSLKALAALSTPDQAKLDRYGKVFARGQTVLAVSTHPGEEEAVLEGYTAARAKRPGLMLILAPRHPDRGTAVASLLERANLNFRVRSMGEEPAPGIDVYLADTLGEVALWYALAGQT
ncbi:MAG: glycosyltransferase N-terminal domain-containing protein, partial [Pseudomonadota bacterium]